MALKKHLHFSALFAAFIVLFSCAAFAAQPSSISMEVANSELIVSSVVDDDASIEKVDVFTVNSGVADRYSFLGVLQGQTLAVPFTESTTISFNFTDTDGAQTGLGTFIVVQQGNPLEPPADSNSVNQVPNVIESISLEPRLAQGNGAYYIDAIVSVNPDYPLASAALYYGLNSATLSQSKQLFFNGSEYVGSFGPFTQKIEFNAKAVATAASGETFEAASQKFFQLLLPSVDVCSEFQNFSSAPQTSAENETVASFATLSGFSVLKISKAQDGKLAASYVYDDDDSIERADIFFQKGGSVTQYTYTTVSEGDSIGSIPLDTDYSWFNFFDFDGSVSNVSALNQFGAAGEGATTPDYISGISLAAELSASETTFALSASASAGSDVPDSVEIHFTLDDGAERIQPLNDTNSGFTAFLGSFDGEFTVSGFVEATGPEGIQRIYFSPYWFALIPEEELQCVELCGDKIDNNFDGRVDEGCVELPELFFLNKNLPYYSLTGKPIKGDLTVKNSGVVSSPGFEVHLSIDGTIVSTQVVSGLAENTSATVAFEIPFQQDYVGVHELRALIDPSNKVPELEESNNEYAQKISIGDNYFDLQLNYNETFFPGDFRQFRVQDAFGKTIEGAEIEISTPDAKTLALRTDARGIAEFQLPKAGVYSVTVSKPGFIPFEGSFAIVPLIFTGLTDIVVPGTTQKFFVENQQNRKVESGTVELSLPNGETQRFDLASAPEIEFQASIEGKYALRVVRNNLNVLERQFVVGTPLEFSLFGVDLAELLFGSIVREPLLILFLIIVSALSAAFAYFRVIIFFPKGVKTSRQRQVENAVRIGLSLLYFLVPMAASKFYGFNPALLVVFLEKMVILLGDYYLKRFHGGKAIKV